jgi:hypothetical protein
MLYKICTTCEIHHYRNCRTCFGFGIWKRRVNGEIVAVSADVVMGPHKVDPEEFEACPECRSTIQGLPKVTDTHEGRNQYAPSH